MPASSCKNAGKWFLWWFCVRRGTLRLRLLSQIYFVSRYISRKTAADKKREARKAAAAAPVGDTTPLLVPVPAASVSAPSTVVPFAVDARIDDTEWTTHAICVATYQAKHLSSRRNIPPALVFAASGFGAGEEGTHAWEAMQDVRHKNGKGALKKFWKGEWAEYEEDKRWWEPLAEVWEPRRLEAMQRLQGAA